MNWRFASVLISLVFIGLCIAMPNNFTDQETHKRNRIVLPDFDGKLSHKTHKGNDQGQSLFNTLTKAGLDIKNTPNGEEREQMKQAVSLYTDSDTNHYVVIYLLYT